MVVGIRADGKPFFQIQSNQRYDKGGSFEETQREAMEIDEIQQSNEESHASYDIIKVVRKEKYASRLGSQLAFIDMA
jgi:hypothetical protein